jgi:hypothetical protein
LELLTIQMFRGVVFGGNWPLYILCVGSIFQCWFALLATQLVKWIDDGGTVVVGSSVCTFEFAVV